MTNLQIKLQVVEGEEWQEEASKRKEEKEGRARGSS